MKQLSLISIAFLTLLCACVQQPQYVWQHPDGLGDIELQRDQKICTFLAEKNITTYDYNNFPEFSENSYQGFPFYGHPELIKRHADYFYWHREFYRQGFYTFSSVDDMAMACMQGNGWYRTELVPAPNAASDEARQLAMKLRELTGL